MTDVITFFFQLLTDVLAVIISHWLLSVFFLITIFSWIVGLINQTRGSGNK